MVLVASFAAAFLLSAIRISYVCLSHRRGGWTASLAMVKRNRSSDPAMSERRPDHQPRGKGHVFTPIEACANPVDSTS